MVGWTEGFPKWVAALLATLVLQAAGQEAKPSAKTDEPYIFTIEQVIHPAVAKLPAPDYFEHIVTLPMAISARDEPAQRHVQQGMALINASWDFEAYRHFCEAVRADRNCLMAYWGIALALAAPNSEFTVQRAVAVNRMLDLMEQEVGTAIERDYALALASLFATNAQVSSKAFSRLADAYPNNLQAKLLAAYMKRGGYDEFGDATVAQEDAIEEMRRYLNLHADDITVLNFWAMLHAEEPDTMQKLPNQVLPFARKIVRVAPDFPPYQHLLGHFEWRCGNHRLAEAAFVRASELYDSHMKKHGLTFHDCDGWLRSRLYLVTAIYSQGRFEEAMAIAKELAALQIDDKRIRSAGANLVLWEAHTLPARLYLARGLESDFDHAIASLPGKDDPQLFRKQSLSILYLEGLRQYLGARRELMKGDRDLANEFRTALSATGEFLVKAQAQAAKGSAISEYIRALRDLEAHSAEMRGMIALAGEGGEQRAAYNWFTSAVSKQQRPTMLMPPPTMYPMEVRLGEYYLRTGEIQKAAETFWEGLTRRPNDLAALRGYQTALRRLDREADAARIGKQIEMVKGK